VNSHSDQARNKIRARASAGCPSHGAHYKSAIKVDLVIPVSMFNNFRAMLDRVKRFKHEIQDLNIKLDLNLVLKGPLEP